MKFRYKFESMENQNDGLEFESNHEDEEEALKERGFDPFEYLVIKITEVHSGKVIFDAWNPNAT